MAGVWCEKHILGGRVPYTLYCLMSKQLKRVLAYDRHWFERANRPHAFTKSKFKVLKDQALLKSYAHRP